MVARVWMPGSERQTKPLTSRSLVSALPARADTVSGHAEHGLAGLAMHGSPKRVVIKTVTVGRPALPPASGHYRASRGYSWPGVGATV